MLFAFSLFPIFTISEKIISAYLRKKEEKRKQKREKRMKGTEREREREKDFHKRKEKTQCLRMAN